jgi:outer membrane protein TolC
LAVADAYFNVQQARGRLAGADDSAVKADLLLGRINALSSGLISPIESNRARTLLAAIRQSGAKARGEWGIASAQLTRALRLDPTSTVIPDEPPHLQVTLIGPGRDLDELIPIGLLSRPELASHQALVQANLARLRQERMRPLLPTVMVVGDAVPTAPGNYLMGGIFASNNGGQAAPTVLRNDVAVQAVWGVNNLGFGNRAMIRERQAEQGQSVIELNRTQDMVAAEVAQAFAQLNSATLQVVEAETGVRQAQESFAGNLRGMSETTRFGDILVLVNRPQEVVAALQQLATAYDNYFISVNEYNRAQFRLYRALGYPAGVLAYEQSLGQPDEIDTSRPQPLPPVLMPCPPR